MGGAMGMGLEKRKFQRLDLQLDVDVEIVTAGASPSSGPPLRFKSRNLSDSGICLEANAIEIDAISLISGPPGARDNRLRMRISLFPDEVPCEAFGEVCWYDIARDGSEFRYQLGIDFIKVSADGKDQLARFLKGVKPDTGLLHRLFG